MNSSDKNQMDSLVKQWREIAGKYVVNYKTDIDHDCNLIEKQFTDKNCDKIIFSCRENGTHAFECRTPESMPARNESIPYLFGNATGERIVSQMELYEGETVAGWWLYDVNNNSIVNITIEQGRQEMLDCQKRIRDYWDTQEHLNRIDLSK